MPPKIYKHADKEGLGLGDEVRFIITVQNPSGPTNEVVWTELVVTDAVDPALRIDAVTLDPPVGDVATIGNTAMVTDSLLYPGQWFATYVDCTLVGPVEPGQVITNGVSLRYVAPDHIGRGPLEAPDPPSMAVLYSTLLPLVMRGSS